MKWNFLYQITAASRPPDYGATVPRSPFSLSSVNWICWTPPPPEKNSWVRHWQETYVGYDCKLFINRFYTKNWMMILITTTISLWNFNGLFIRVRPIPSESSGSHVTPCLVCLLDPTQHGTLKTNLSMHMPLRDMWKWTHSYKQPLSLAIELRAQHHAQPLIPWENSLRCPQIGD
jgi:hypothetical protein